jgi:hypothetical protein
MSKIWHLGLAFSVVFFVSEASIFLLLALPLRLTDSISWCLGHHRLLMNARTSAAVYGEGPIQ